MMSEWHHFAVTLAPVARHGPELPASTRQRCGMAISAYNPLCALCARGDRCLHTAEV